MNPETRAALVARLSLYDRPAEVGIGTRIEVAAALADRGATVVATDVVERDVPEGVEFVRDDVVDPELSAYAGVDVVYALNLPRELHRPAHDLARTRNVPLFFTTLGGEFPAIPARRETIPGDTLFACPATGRGARPGQVGPGRRTSEVRNPHVPGESSDG